MTEEEPNPNAKYEALTEFRLREIPQRINALEETVTNTLAGYRQREVPEGEKLGKGFGTKLYDDLRNAYATQRGIDPSKLEGEISDIFEEKVMKALGLTRKGLEDDFASRDKLTDDDIKQLKGKVQKSVSKVYDEEFNGQLARFGDEDLEPFKNYVAGALGALGGNVDKSRFVTIQDTIEAYNLLLNTKDKVGEAEAIGELITKIYGPKNSEE